MGEAFSEFKDSFSYGSRNDLNFKFLKGMSDEEAADVLRSILVETGHVWDSGDPAALIEVAIEAQAAAYGSRELNERYRYDRTPFTPLAAPVTEAAVALLTSSGHFVDGDDPEPFGVTGMTQEQSVARISDFLRAAPRLSAIPVDTPSGDLVVRHGGYDVSGAREDHQVVLPLGHLAALEADGAIGRLVDTAYSFVGAAAQGRILKQSGPEWAGLLADHGTDIALLVPV